MAEKVDIERAVHLLALFVAAAVFSSSPAMASDFTGILTFFASITGVVLVWIWGTLFAISRTSKRPKIRKRMPYLGLVVGITLTAWWIADPIAESTAAGFLLAVPFIALCIVGGEKESSQPDQEKQLK